MIKTCTRLCQPNENTTQHCHQTNHVCQSNDTCSQDEYKTLAEHDEPNHCQISSRISEFYATYSLSITLENKGNTARDHLANERTYLAWFRTSLTLVTLGISIVQLYHAPTASHTRLGKALGLVFMMTSILFLYFGNIRYFHAQKTLQHGNFPASRGVITWASFCILFLFVGMFTVICI